MPISSVFRKGKETRMSDRSGCVKCKRDVHFIYWKKGTWDKIKNEIAKGADLSDQPAPRQDLN